MNYVALNQNILGKKLVIGSGFVGGTEKPSNRRKI